MCRVCFPGFFLWLPAMFLVLFLQCSFQWRWNEWWWLLDDDGTLHATWLIHWWIDTGQQDAIHITAILGESVVFNCHVEFPGDHPVPFVLQWEKKVSESVRHLTLFFTVPNQNFYFFPFTYTTKKISFVHTFLLLFVLTSFVLEDCSLCIPSTWI